MKVLKHLKNPIRSYLIKNKLNSLIFQNLESLKVIQFWRIVKTDEVQLLDLEYNPKKKYSEEELSELNKRWKLLYDEFFDLRQNKSGKYLMEKTFELRKISAFLERLYDMEHRAILLIELEENKELSAFVAKRITNIILEFKALYPKVKLDTLSNPRETLSILQQVIKSQTNIYDEKLGAKDNTVKKQEDTVHTVASKMGKALGYNLHVNDMTCLEFLGHENALIDSEKSSQNIKKTK